MDKEHQAEPSTKLDPAVEAAIARAVARGIREAMATQRPPTTQRMVDSAEAMKILACSRTSLYRLISEKRLTARKFGAKNRFALSEVEALLNTGT